MVCLYEVMVCGQGHLANVLHQLVTLLLCPRHSHHPHRDFGVDNLRSIDAQRLAFPVPQAALRMRQRSEGSLAAALKVSEGGLPLLPELLGCDVPEALPADRHFVRKPVGVG